jgi:hypothetical protein
MKKLLAIARKVPKEPDSSLTILFDTLWQERLSGEVSGFRHGVEGGEKVA